MNPDHYQQECLKTYLINPKDGLVLYPALGLANEVGELLGHAKKFWRDDNKVLTPERRAKMKAEAGDCLWYLAVLLHDCGVSLSDAMQHNIDKLRSRAERGTIRGSGDDR